MRSIGNLLILAGSSYILPDVERLDDKEADNTRKCKLMKTFHCMRKRCLVPQLQSKTKKKLCTDRTSSCHCLFGSVLFVVTPSDKCKLKRSVIQQDFFDILFVQFTV